MQQRYDFDIDEAQAVYFVPGFREVLTRTPRPVVRMLVTVDLTGG